MTILLDSNVIIYATRPELEFEKLTQYLAERSFFVSIVSYVEVLGFKGLDPQDANAFRAFFDKTGIVQLDREIAERAVQLRQLRKMSLGDALIAATALEKNLTLLTYNTDDFKWIVDLNLLIPQFD